MSYYRSRDLKKHSTNCYPFNEYNKIQESFQQSFNTNSPHEKNNIEYFQQSFNTNSPHEKNNSQYFQQSFNTNSPHEKNNIEYFQQNFHQNVEKKVETEDDKKSVIIYENKILNGVNPLIWGPSFWFTLHNGSIRYALKPSPILKERMKQFVLNIPIMIPCEKCADHAQFYIESHYDKIDEIVSSKSNLFEFFWKFHNEVNSRLNKTHITLQKAYDIYNGKIEMKCLKY